MAGVRVLVGTKKGAFVCTSDEGRKDWKVEGPFFAGWEIYHAKGSPLNTDTIFVSQTSGWFGQIIQRSDDGGKTWYQPGLAPGEPTTTPEGFPMGESNRFAYDTSEATGRPLTTHQFYDGTQQPWVFKRVWHLEPSLTDLDSVYAGVEDAALFKTTNGGKTWEELSGLRGHPSGEYWMPGAGGLGLHTILLDPTNPDRIHIAISAAGAFRSDDGGKTWAPKNKGLTSKYLPDPNAEFGFCVHRLAMHPAKPNTLYMQLHWHVCRSDDGGDNWRKVSGDLPIDFGFPIAVHPQQPETIYVVPIQSDSEHFVPGGALKVYRSKTGGEHWEPLTNGLPQQNCYVNILREAMSTDTCDEGGVYFGTTGGQVFVSTDGGDHWTTIAEHFPAVLSVEAQRIP